MKANDLNKMAESALDELSETRHQFLDGKMPVDNAKAAIGLFNATAKMLNTAMQIVRMSKT